MLVEIRNSKCSCSTVEGFNSNEVDSEQDKNWSVLAVKKCMWIPFCDDIDLGVQNACSYDEGELNDIIACWTEHSYLHSKLLLIL